MISKSSDDNLSEREINRLADYLVGRVEESKRRDTHPPLFLLRVWGKDQGQIAALRAPDAIERDGDGPLCYWFHSTAERTEFEQTFGSAHVVHDRHDPGCDWAGELIDTRALTVASILLKYDGREVALPRESFGYGYPAHSAEGMWREGNNSCDCNKRLYIWRQERLSEDEIDKRDNPCGDIIQLISITVTKEPL